MSRFCERAGRVSAVPLPALESAGHGAPEQILAALRYFALDGIDGIDGIDGTDGTDGIDVTGERLREMVNWANVA
ncbi:hypothetical protein ACFVT2_23815 [Streptomyces sp. NPDC058000]|uniref:hypothetical protein n=1 Tax=Streptomyces sp. NPDC058000 TaxID=3346299 RepID=UPI0036EBE7D2